VQVELRREEFSDDWRISLYSERGFWSRQQLLRRVGYVACADPCALPPLDIRFTAEDEVTFRFDDQLVYQVAFDPHTLQIRDEHCHVAHTRTPPETRDAVGCLEPPTGFWGWFSDA
jgi:hypothetical protein